MGRLTRKPILIMIGQVNMLEKSVQYGSKKLNGEEKPCIHSGENIKNIIRRTHLCLEKFGAFTLVQKRACDHMFEYFFLGQRARRCTTMLNNTSILLYLCVSRARKSYEWTEKNYFSFAFLRLRN